MNRDELLDKLAMELAEWPGIDCHSAHRDFGTPDDCLWEFSQYGWSLLIVLEIGERIIKQDWLKRREELINCPPDSEAPEWAEWKAQEKCGEWCWYKDEPVLKKSMWDIPAVDSNYQTATHGKIPSGHDWRTTLTRINRDDNTSTPEEEEEFERIQARQDADKPHVADARMLDAQLSDAMGKQPRYLDATGEDWIDEFARTATLDEFRGAMRFTIGKYNRRVGRKDEILNEVRKMKDYCARWESYETALAAKECGK